MYIKGLLEKYKFTLVLIFISIILGIPLMLSDNNDISKLIIWLPLLVVIIKTMQNYYQIKDIATLFINVCSLPFIFLGHMWFMTFVFTDYRSHLAVIGIPLSIIFLGIGIKLLDKYIDK